MALTSKQFTYLQEMDISLWQHKQDNNLEHSQAFLPINSQILNSSQCWQDILTALNTLSSDVVITEKQLKLTLFNWSFHHKPDITLTNNLLITPDLTILCQSPMLKKQLWQILTQFL